ncbi:MAG: hypothetical protein ACI9NT_001437, partial [Bacteroidia bacterium]
TAQALKVASRRPAECVYKASCHNDALDQSSRLYLMMLDWCRAGESCGQ